MRIEWAWLRSRPRVAEPANEIVLDGETRCRVLLLHGLTGTPTEFAFIAHFLHRRGRLSVECPRLVNHGQPLAVLARTRWQELLSSARDHLLEASTRAKRDGARLVVGGLSLGAVLSLILAAESPDRVAGVMALSPTLFYDGWNVPWSQGLIGLADYLPVKHFIYLREQPPYGLKDESLRRKVAATYEQAKLGEDSRAAELGYAHFPLRLFCEMRHLIALCKRVLPRVQAPLLVLQAADDDATSPRNAHYILRHVGSRSTQLVLLANSYHVITADLDRTEVAHTMTGFCLSLLDAEPGTAGADHA
ncbi:MAG TPA: alpha/beta fold hydrolase [Casimicrobiaceae bacterium]|nr:alpha/beta fold hydrolase [Casimicrobiaceae bacterium]